MSDPITSEVWMRIAGSNQMHRVGTVTYEKDDLDNGKVTLDSLIYSVNDFIAEMNEILGGNTADLDG